MAASLRAVFITGDPNDTPERGWGRFRDLCDSWSRHYPAIGRMAENERYRLYFTYLCYDYRTRSMLYSTNWIERLNRDYKRTTKMRGALPNPEATLLLLGHVAMNRPAYQRKVPMLQYERRLFRWEDESSTGNPHKIFYTATKP